MTRYDIDGKITPKIYIFIHAQESTSAELNWAMDI